MDSSSHVCIVRQLFILMVCLASSPYGASAEMADLIVCDFFRGIAKKNIGLRVRLVVVRGVTIVGSHCLSNAQHR